MSFDQGVASRRSIPINTPTQKLSEYDLLFALPPTAVANSTRDKRDDESKSQYLRLERGLPEVTDTVAITSEKSDVCYSNMKPVR